MAPEAPSIPSAEQDPLHVAIIMDGNGRWARRRHMPRKLGHREGARAVRAVVETAADPANGIGTLTLYAFSSDNWHRPADEVRGVMALFHEYLRRETARCVKNNVRLRVVGRRDRLSSSLVQAIEAAESATADLSGLTLRLAVDYSARDLIVRAAAIAAERARSGVAHPGAARSAGAAATSDVAGDVPASPTDSGELASHPAFCREAFRECLALAEGGDAPVPDVDLLIRTGGDQRISDFLLWECAYAELVFTPRLWPDFREADLRAAVEEFHRRERRFGRVLEEAG